MTQAALLGDLVDISSSKRIFYKEYVSSGVPFYRSKEIIERATGKKDISTELFISEERFNEIESKFGAPREGDLLLTSVGTLGIPYLVQKNEKFYFKDGNLTWFRNFTPELDRTYLLYWLTSQDGKRELLNHSIGSTQKAFTIQGLKKVRVPLPSIETQKRIADILGTIDEKIELNRRMNETLEQMGQALFRHYFIDNPEVEKWETGQLDDLFEIIMGQSPPGSSYNEDGNGITFYQGRTEFGVRFPSKRLSTIDPKRLAKKGDTLLSVRAPVGDINQATEDCCIGRGIAAISSKADQTSFCYYSCRNLQGKFAEYNSEGTVFGAINAKQLKSLKVQIPPSGVIEKFEQEVNKLDAQILTNSQQIQTLTTLRNTLLPRLISGEVNLNGTD